VEGERKAAPVGAYFGRAVFVERYFDILRESREAFIRGVVDDFDQRVIRVHRVGIHPRAMQDRREILEDFDVLCGVGVGFLCHEFLQDRLRGGTIGRENCFVSTAVGANRVCQPGSKLGCGAYSKPCADQPATFARMRGTRFGLSTGTCNAGISRNWSRTKSRNNRTLLARNRAEG
jgi:hypothetical protein